jgi:hypothetical protein
MLQTLNPIPYTLNPKHSTRSELRMIDGKEGGGGAGGDGLRKRGGAGSAKDD